MPRIKPSCRIQDLWGEPRQVVLALIRLFAKDMIEVATHLGLEGTEETLIELINTGEVAVKYDRNEGVYWLEVYDAEEDCYRRGGKLPNV